MIYWQLFLSFLQVGLFSIGGGYAAMPIIQGQAVTLHQWLTMSEFTDLVTIAEMTPGPIAINAATFVGTRMAGLSGAIIATFGCIFPSILIVSLLSYVYTRYQSANGMKQVLSCLRPTVVALIASAGLTILITVIMGHEINLSAINWVGVALFSGALYLLIKKHWNPIMVMVCCGVIQLAISIIQGL